MAKIIDKRTGKVSEPRSFEHSEEPAKHFENVADALDAVGKGESIGGGGGVIVFTAVQQNDDEVRVQLSAPPSEIYAAVASGSNVVIEFAPSETVAGAFSAYRAYLKPCFADDLEQIAFEGYIAVSDSQDRWVRQYFTIFIGKNNTDTLGWVSMYEHAMNQL